MHKNLIIPRAGSADPVQTVGKTKPKDREEVVIRI